MYTITLSIIAILAALLANPSSAQPSGENSILGAAQLSGTVPVVMSVTYKNSITERTAVNPKPASSAIDGPRIRGIRNNSMSKNISRTDMFTENDHFSSTVYAPMQGVNNVLSLVEAAFHSQLEDSLVTWIQALSLLARRQINTEFAYSIKTNKTSKFDTVLSYKLNPSRDSGKPTAIASLQYHAKF